jgi:glycogen debranching enzyme
MAQLEVIDNPIRSQFPSNVQTPLNGLALHHETFDLHGAGSPSYAEGIFARDEIITSELLEDAYSLRSILEFAAVMQGKKKDPLSGEQPGAIFHEYNIRTRNGVELAGREGLNTLYNASDTNAHFLRGHEQYIEMTGDWGLFEKHRPNVIAATEYTLRHLDSNSLFVIDPKHADADRFALKVTYWKDSELKDRENGEPLYPVIYPLSHIQNLSGIRSAARLLRSTELAKTAENMKEALPYLFDKQLDALSIAIDRGGRISGISSDILHALHYLNPMDIDPKSLERFLVNTSILETSFGYRTLSAQNAEEVSDAYHAKTVWTHEQAIIHKGASAHRKWARKKGLSVLEHVLSRVVRVSERVYANYLKDHEDKNPELFIVHDDGSIEPGGNDPQAWAIGARYYFTNKLG